MLNELIQMERGLSAAGFVVSARHPDVKSPGKKEALRVRLQSNGQVAEIDFLTGEFVAGSWKLSEGQHNSFPLIQFKKPLLNVPSDEKGRVEKAWREEFEKTWKGLKRSADKRHRLRHLTEDFPLAGWMDAWPGSNFDQSLRRRINALETLRGSDAGAVPALVERFLIGCRQPRRLFQGIVDALLVEVAQADDDKFLDAAKNLMAGSGIVYCDVARNEFSRDAADPRTAAAVSLALIEAEHEGPPDTGECALTGKTTSLQSGPFPQPKLGKQGQVYLFAKNKEIRAAGRYGRFAAQAFAVGQSTVARLAGVLTELTAEERKGKTWRDVPGERLKQTDLLIAYVEQAPDEPIPDLLAEDGEEFDGEGEFLARTERLIDAVKAKVGADFRKTPVQASVVRRVDLGNHKVICSRSFSVNYFFEAAKEWSDGERNVPPWLQLPVPGNRGQKATRRHPPHVAPLKLPLLTRSKYIRGGVGLTTIVGLGAQDAFGLFLKEGDGQRRARTTLRVILRRHGDLLSGVAHALHKDQVIQRKIGAPEAFAHAKAFNRNAALQSLTIIGVLLWKLERDKETYMNDAAFKLGQFLAAADTVHIGYCTDMRGGDVPPVLLGNAVFSIAQSNPARALAVLTRRWKPYGAWVKRVETKKDENRPWPIRNAVSQARRIQELCRNLSMQYPKRTDDVFRAELLLGYIAGLPRVERKDSEDILTSENDQGGKADDIK